MAVRMTEKLKEKRFVMLIAGIVLFLIIVMLLIFALTGNAGKWTEGGMDTSAKFRYRVRSSGDIELRVDTSSLPTGRFEVQKKENSKLETVDTGIKGNEQIYYISGDDVAYENWTLAYYTAENGASEQECYVLSMDISEDEKGKLSVIGASSQDVQPVINLQVDEYDCEYQIQNGMLSITIHFPMQIRWYAEFDDQILSTTDFFYEQEYVTTHFMCITDQEVDTDLCLYTNEDSTSSEEVRMDEIHLKIKCKDGTITEVAYE